MAALLEIPNAIYDYLLYYECSNKDWSDKNAKLRVGREQPGFLINNVNWNVSSTTVAGDSGGATKCGITHSTWSSFYSKNSSRYGLTCGSNINYMDRKGWLSYIQHSWDSGPGLSANIACAIVIFQAKWGGWSGVSNCLNEVKNNADIKDYNFITSGDNWKKLADATHAYKDPMNAYWIIRNNHIQYLWNISSPGMKNSKFRTGWMRREVPTFQEDGLYVEPGLSQFNTTNTQGFKLDQWESLSKSLKSTEPKYVKIYSWDNPVKDEEPVKDWNGDEIKSPFPDTATRDYTSNQDAGGTSKITPTESGIQSKNIKFSGVLVGTHMRQK